MLGTELVLKMRRIVPKMWKTRLKKACMMGLSVEDRIETIGGGGIDGFIAKIKVLERVFVRGLHCVNRIPCGKSGLIMLISSGEVFHVQ